MYHPQQILVFSLGSIIPQFLLLTSAALGQVSPASWADAFVVPMVDGVHQPSGGAAVEAWAFTVQSNQELDVRQTDLSTFQNIEVERMIPCSINGDDRPDYLAICPLGAGGHSLKFYSTISGLDTQSVLLAGDDSVVGGSGATLVDVGCADFDYDGLDEVAVWVRPPGGPAENINLLVYEVELGNVSTCLSVLVAADYFTFDEYSQTILSATSGNYYYDLGTSSEPKVAALVGPAGGIQGNDDWDLLVYPITMGIFGQCCGPAMAADYWTFDESGEFEALSLTTVHSPGENVDWLVYGRQSTSDSDNVDYLFYEAPADLFGATSAQIRYGEYWMLDAGGQSLSQGTLNPTATFQDIDGFGASIAFSFNAYHGMSAANKDTVADLVFRDLGATILRIRAPAQIEMVNDNSDPGVLNLAGFDFQSNDPSQCAFDIVGMAECWHLAIDHPGSTINTVIASSWSPPPWMKTGGCNCDICQPDPCVTWLCGGNLDMAQLAEFAEWWAGFILGMELYHDISVDAISIQNEPAASTGYHSMLMSDSDLGQAVHAVSDRFFEEGIGAGIMVPEHGEVSQSAASLDSMLGGDPSLVGRLWAAATHGYPPPGSGWTQFDSVLDQHAPSLRRWQTEAGELGSLDTGIGSAVKWAEMAYRGFVKGGVNATMYWQYFWPLKSTGPQGLVLIDTANDKIIVPKHYHVFRHYSEFIRPGFVRIGSWANGSGHVLSAFQNPASEEFVAVLVNTSEQRRFVKIDTGTNMNGLIADLYVTTGIPNGNHNYRHTPGLSTHQSRVIIPVKGKGVYTLRVH